MSWNHVLDVQIFTPTRIEMLIESPVLVKLSGDTVISNNNKTYKRSSNIPPYFGRILMEVHLKPKVFLYY